MKEEIAVSVFCLAYNHEKYIRHALEGFVNQKTDFKYEVFIHDDASTDGTAAIIREYEEKYPELIKPIYQTENQYSQGIKIGDTHLYPRARGKYICWCEGDDYWCSEDKLQKQYDAMEAHPECSMCVHKVKCVNEDGSPNDRVIPEERYSSIHQGVLSEDDMVQALWIDGGYPFHTSSFFVTRELLDYRKSHQEVFAYFNGDMKTLRAAFSIGQIYYLDEAMSCRRLFSKNGWNDRFRNSDMHKRIEFWKRQVYGELKYNEFTEGKYENHIKICVLQNILGWCIFEPHEAKKLIIENGLGKETAAGIKSRKGKIYYFLLLHWIGAFKIIAVLKSFRDKAKEWKTKMKK